MTPFRRSFRGILAIVGAQLAFLLNDTLVKLVSARMPLGQIIFMRGLVAIALIGGVAVVMGLHRSIPLLRNRMVFWRVLGEIGGTFFYLGALFHMPIGNVTVIFQAVPLTVTAGAALVLGEPVGWRRWAAILIGFTGVIIIVRPGLTGFDVYAVLVLVSVLFVSMRDLTTRALPAATPTLLVTLVTAAAITVMGAVYGMTEVWIPPTGRDVLQLAGAAILLSIGYATSILAVRLGEMSVTAPFRYVAVVFGISLGFLVWGDIPDALTSLGSIVIVAAGLYTLYRERRAAAGTSTTTAAMQPPSGG
jgi:drug/metabolite transporter (DMT)-like permease